MTTAWQTRNECLTDPDEIVLRLVSLAKDQHVFRGQADKVWPLQCGLDRMTVQTMQTDPYVREQDLLNDWHLKTQDHLPPLEWRHAAAGRLNRIAVAQHHGLKTRSLDWTTNPLVAALFCCIGDEQQENDGAVWWFDQRCFEKWLHDQWKAWGVKRCLNHDGSEGQVQIEPDIFDPAYDKSFVTKLHFPPGIAPMDRQNAFLMIRSRLGREHDTFFDETVPEEVARGRVIIPHKCKSAVLCRLERLGVTCPSILHPYADIVARSINDRGASCRPADHGGSSPIPTGLAYATAVDAVYRV